MALPLECCSGATQKITVMQTLTTNATLINPNHNLFVFFTHNNTFVAAQTAIVVAELAAKDVAAQNAVPVNANLVGALQLQHMITMVGERIDT